jgi:hypothetical protein
MAISDQLTTEVNGVNREVKKTEVLMSRSEKLHEWLKNTGIGRALIGENNEKIKYWAGLSGALQGGMMGYAASENPFVAAASGAALGSVGFMLSKWLDERNTIGHRLAPVPVAA